MQLQVLGVGIVAPGLPDWSAAAVVLRGEQPYRDIPLTLPPPVGLMPTERRRATVATRAALEAARQATASAPCAASVLRSVFASSDGDMELIDSLCRATFERREPPSPTVFQNSVHNAVAGYWSLAEGCREASTSLAAGDGSLAAGLLEAAAQALCAESPVLLVAFDVPAPELLHPHRPFVCPFACALVLAPASAGREPTLALALREVAAGQAETTMADAALETMRTGNPAARALPLLAALAAAGPAVLRLPYWPELALEARLSRSRR